jgi:hypothetical protein
MSGGARALGVAEIDGVMGRSHERRRGGDVAEHGGGAEGLGAATEIWALPFFSPFFYGFISSFRSFLFSLLIINFSSFSSFITEGEMVTGSARR